MRMTAIFGTVLIAAAAARGAAVTQADRGALVETDQLRITIRDGVLTGFVNKFTGEEYIDPLSNTDELLKVLPGGLGTQHREEERKRAFELFHYPWWEHPVDSRWPNQHHPTSHSSFTYEQTGPAAATLTYTGLTDGTAEYKDESYSLNIAVEENGDVAITPEARSPRGGVYGVNLTVAPLMPAITVEAPIFDGVRITRDMQPMLWNVLWANYWDYAFVALNGYKRGAIGIWCPDAELKYSKTLYHMVDDQGLSLSFHGMNIPPFEELREAKPVTWKIRAFETGWSEAVAHFREWRLANVTIAERPDWSKTISFVNMGVNGGKMWVDLMDAYFEGRHLDRTLTFAATIRAEGFDRNHTNNTPYEGFKEDMKYWKEKGPKLMAYLNPVIMWSPNPKTEREQQAVKLAAEAKTIMPFQGPDAESVRHFDVQHLGHAGWQRWFLDWVKEYCQDYGADAVYFDEGQKTPLDNRGLVNGMTPTMGRADFHYQSQAENPNSAFGTEHGASVNNVGVSFSIGGGILWGTAQSMRHQRIEHASAVSNALHHPNSVIRSFPHYSEYHSRGDVQNFHWGMDQMERRAEIAGHSIQKSRLFNGQTVPYEHWVNELWLERQRATTFVWEGLRPFFPEDWAKGVRSYHRAADGDEFRYVDRPWGSALVEIGKDGGERMIYARLHGTIYAETGKTGAIAGWPVYNENGPAGLNPSRYYVFDPGRQRPDTYFRTNHPQSPGFYEGYVERGFVSDSCAMLDLKAIPEIGNITRYDSVVLVSDTKPAAIWINGKPAPVTERVLSQKRVTGPDGKPTWEKEIAEGEYQINFQLPATICVLFKEPAALTEAEKTIAARYVSGSGPERRPVFDDAFVQASRPDERQARRIDLPNPVVITDIGYAGVPFARYDITVPVALPEGAEKGEMALTVQTQGGNAGFHLTTVNGVETRTAVATPAAKTAQTVIRVPLDAKQRVAMIQLETDGTPVLSLAWEETDTEE